MGRFVLSPARRRIPCGRIGPTRPLRDCRRPGDFGRRWSESFAVTVLKRNERNFTAAGLNLPALEGRRIRVRGWIEARGAARSPEITVDHPEQIELADGK